jgi:hypothetical protein
MQRMRPKLLRMARQPLSLDLDMSRTTRLCVASMKSGCETSEADYLRCRVVCRLGVGRTVRAGGHLLLPLMQRE